MYKKENVYTNGSLFVVFNRSREGPHHFTVYYKGSAKFVTSVKQIKPILGPAKFLDSSKELYAWMEERLDSTKKKAAPELDMDAVKKEGFGPEAHEEPNDNTKMVV